MSDTPQISFAIQKIYVKDLSLEIPNSPQVFLERETPKIDFELSHAGALIDENIHEVILKVTVSAKHNEKIFFLLEMTQAGIFKIENAPDDRLEIILGIACPDILFPYAREVVSNAIVRGGFPPLELSPVNFEAMYAEKKKELVNASSNQEMRLS